VAEGVGASRGAEALLDVKAEVRAAGGIVRRVVDGEIQLVLVHRPSYDDWSFPKGKELEGEHSIEAAAREVLEETGLRCRIGAELPSSSYEDRNGRSKTVRYWAMEPEVGSDLHPTGEVDEARWFDLAVARAVLTYERDRQVLDALLDAAAPAYLIRHAKAGDRAAWSGDDRDRPLSKSGRRQARALVRLLSSRPIERILSSPALRCVQTVRSIADERGLPIEGRDELLEGASLAGLTALVDDAWSVPTILCAHGDLIPAAVEYYQRQGARVGADPGWKKGSVWVLEREFGLIVRASYVPPTDGEPKRGAGSLPGRKG
jgi:phosphohistidine phosphatase SixA/8-oxo-dGTP pyrophosphatase MutT (NUDIX family)